MGLASSRLTVLKLPPQRTIFIMDYMPRCPCGVVLTDLRTQEELRKWAHREGDCWGRRPNGTPYWYFCLRCHLRRWPNDRRYNNRWSTPAPPLWHMACSGVHRLVAGDFYLTCPPPERRRDELAEPRRVRHDWGHLLLRKRGGPLALEPHDGAVHTFLTWRAVSSPLCGKSPETSRDGATSRASLGLKLATPWGAPARR